MSTNRGATPWMYWGVGMATLVLVVLGIVASFHNRDGKGQPPSAAISVAQASTWDAPKDVKTLLVGKDLVKVSVKEFRPFLMRPLEDEEVVLLHEGEEYRKRGKDGVWIPSLPEPFYPVQAQVKSGTKKMVRFEVATW